MAVQVAPVPPGTAPTANVAVQATGGSSAPVPPSATMGALPTSTVPTTTVAVQATTGPSTTVQVALTGCAQQTTPTKTSEDIFAVPIGPAPRSAEKRKLEILSQTTPVKPGQG